MLSSAQAPTGRDSLEPLQETRASQEDSEQSSDCSISIPTVHTRARTALQLYNNFTFVLFMLHRVHMVLQPCVVYDSSP